MKEVEIVIEAIVGLFILFVFGAIILPELAKTAGQEIGIYGFIVIMGIVGIIGATIAKILK
ncbi:MAG: hypothetical protein AABX17_01395 [Nanoarchaeota archaeon]